MIDVELKTTEPATVAYISMHGPYSQIPDAFGRLYGWVAQHGMQPTGMPMAVYYTAPDAGPESEAVWELQTPLAGDPAAQACGPDGCGVKRVDAQRVATTMYRGPYDFIEAAYRDLQAWVTTNGYTVDGPPAEVYFSDSATTPPEDYLTEIRVPVAKP